MDQVVAMLNANTKADQFTADMQFLFFFKGNIGMGHGGRVFSQAFGTTQTDRQFDMLQAVQKQKCFLLPTCDIKNSASLPYPGIAC